MVLTPQQLDEIMPDASQLYSDEPEMESSLQQRAQYLAQRLRDLGIDP